MTFYPMGVLLLITLVTSRFTCILPLCSDSRVLLGDMPIAVTVADLVRALSRSFLKKRNRESGDERLGREKLIGDTEVHDLNNCEGSTSGSYVDIDMPEMDSIDSKSIEDLKRNAEQLSKVMQANIYDIFSFKLSIGDDNSKRFQ